MRANVAMRSSRATEGFRVRIPAASSQSCPPPVKGWGTQLVLLCCLVLFAGMRSAAAQEGSSKLAALLERVAFNNEERPEALGAELADLDTDELAMLCEMLVEPGTGDDTKARMALHGLILHLAQGGTAAQERRFVAAIGDALQADHPIAVKVFLLRQLQLVGGEDAIPTVGRYLSDEALCEPAAQALLAIGGEKAARAFARALPEARGRSRVTIVKALRMLPQAAAIPALRKDATNEDWDLRINALGALAASGDPAVADVLLQAADADAWQERAQMTAYLLEFAQRLAEHAHEDDAVLMLRRLIESRTAPEEIHVQCAALHGLAGLLGAEVVGEVVAALTDENAELRAAAVQIAIGLTGPGVTDAYVLEFHRAAADVRAGILDVLRRRGDTAALPVALESLKDEDKVVRLAAVAAAAALGREQAVEPFVTFLETADEDERQAVADALTRTPGDAVSGAIGRALWWHHFPDRQAPHAIPLLLDVIAQRKAKRHLDNVYRWIRNSDEEIKVAAINAVGALDDQRAARRLLDMLEKAESEAVRDALESALVATCQRADSAAQRAAPILKAIAQAVEQDDPREYETLLRVAAQLGGAECRVRLLVAANDARPEIKEAAIRAFELWPDASAARAVLELARDQEATKLHVLALRAYLRMVRLDENRPAEKTVEMYTAAMEVARRPQERRQVLSGLGDVEDARALEVLSPYLDDKALRSEAGSAMIGVARRILPAGWAPARDALERVIEKVNDDRVQRHAKDVLKEVEQHEDFITDWLVAGPYFEKGKNGTEVFDIVFAPEQPEASDVQWKPQPVTRDPARYWHIDLVRSIGDDHRAAYLRTQLWSPQAQEVLLELGSDDGIKVWLNGDVIHANNVPRGCEPGQDKVKAKLRTGWNTLLLKVCNIGGGWGACARVRAADGGRLEGLKIDAHGGP